MKKDGFRCEAGQVRGAIWTYYEQLDFTQWVSSEPAFDSTNSVVNELYLMPYLFLF